MAFLLVVVAVASALPRYGPAWKWFLIGAGCYFYGQWSWKYLLLIVVTAALDYTVARLMLNSRRPGLLLATSVGANLGVLAAFKYANFLIEGVNRVAGAASAGWALAPLDIILPVGISFYTFQNMSYSIDVYRGEFAPRRSVLDYATFATFFPQLLAGPVVRASEFFGQLDRPQPLPWRSVQRALVLILAGYVKKVVLADNLAGGVDAVFSAPAATSPWAALLGVYAFAFQIYFDFSGYTDIAIGLALLFGLEFPKNFDHPYGATSFQDFWRRWHMTLSRWLRDYLYVALGGNRRGAARTTANLMTTMLLGGLWHGASWNFVVWGGLHGIYLALERGVARRVSWWRSTHWSARAVRWLLVSQLVCLAWVFFRAPTLAGGIALLGRIAHLPGAPPPPVELAGLAWLLGGLLALHFGMARWHLKERLAGAGAWAFGSFAATALLALIWFTPAKTVPFIYFRF